MHNWAEICSELKDLEKRVDIKVGLILSTNPDPFPFDRLQKAREIASLSPPIYRRGTGKRCCSTITYTPRKGREIEVGEVGLVFNKT